MWRKYGVWCNVATEFVLWDVVMLLCCYVVMLLCCYVVMLLRCYGDTVIWWGSILLDRTYNTSCCIYFYKYLENKRVSDLPYSHVLNNNIESLTWEVIQLIQENK